MIYDRAKRSVDIAVAAVGLLLLWPVILLVALLVRVRLGNPVLLRQERAGLRGRRFRLLKFRTMLPLDPTRGLIEQEPDRMTPLGRRLRAASLDELPSLFNVLRGDLSVVGPRPLWERYLPLYTDIQRRRHEVRPGITGLAQVSGRNGISWDDRLELDVRYVDTRGPLTDTRILLRTIRTVLARDGIIEEGAATSTAFCGPRRTEDLALRRLQDVDLEHGPEWLSEAALSLGAPDGRLGLAAVDRRTGDVRALCALDAVSARRAHGRVIVEPRLRGRGLGDQAAELLKTEARTRGLSELVLGATSERAGHLVALGDPL